MAVELENRCPICLDSWEEASYVMPCLHQFCYPCIVQWAEKKPGCPLCRRRVSSILHLVKADDDFKEHVITPSLGNHLREDAPRHPGLVGGFYAFILAFVFWLCSIILQLLLCYLEELEELIEDAEDAAFIAALCNLTLLSLRIVFGPDLVL